MASPATLDPAASVSLQASAGSGKTWQLVSRVLRLLLSGAEPGGILALTFTRKAAAEMRLRLNERLRALAEAPEANAAEALRAIGLEPLPATLARARGLYRELLFAPFPPSATTLHAFCQELLGRFALEAGVPPDFALVENESALIDQAWRRLQSYLTAEPQGAAAQALATLVQLGFNEWTLRELVTGFLLRRGEWWAYTEGAEDPAALATARLREQLGPCDAQAAVQRLEAAETRAALGRLLRGLEECGDVGSVKAARLAPAAAAEGEARLAALEDALLTDKGEPYAFKPAKRIPQARHAGLIEAHGALLQALLAARDEWIRAQALARGAATFVLGSAALGALHEELAREHALGFTELEWRAYRLLRRDGAADWVRCKLDRRIDHLLIDEFQDTSPTQWRMLLPLLEEMAAGDAGRARSLFIVGDAKQSIYGFRRADPRLLARATDWMQQHLGARVEPLHESRRSAPAVIDFVNALFAPGGAQGLGAQLGFEAHRTHVEDWGRVEVAPPIEVADEAPVAVLAFRDTLTQPRHTREDLRLEQEAALVSARIRALVASGVAVTDAHGARCRLGYGDVMVLARARTHLHTFERQFTADGIPFVGAARGTLLSTSVARDLTALLRLLDAPHRDLELAQVLRSPLYSASDEALAQLALAARDRRSPWLAALDALPEPEPALARARTQIAAWRTLAARLPAHDLLDRILRDSDAAARYEAALPPVTAARARANLGAFLQLALEADSGRYPTLSRFLRWLEAQARAAQDAPDEAPPVATAGQVRVLTIHAAKGLEAPAVFLIQAGASQPPRAPRLLVEWPEDEPQPTHFAVGGPAGRTDPLTRGLAESHKAREAREDLNLLYVAVTRARQFLHISGAYAQRGDSGRSWHAHALRALGALPAAVPAPGAAPGTLAHAQGTPDAAGHAPSAPSAAPADPRLRQPIAIAAAAAAPSARAARDAIHGDLADAADRGTALHYLLERLSEGEADDAALWDGVRARVRGEPDRADFARWLGEVRALLQRPPLARFFDRARYRQAWNEVPVTVDGTAAQIDRLVDDGSALWVIDYKTHARPDAALLAERYRAQLEAYAEAVRAIWPERPVHAGLVLTATGAWVPVLE